MEAVKNLISQAVNQPKEIDLKLSLLRKTREQSPFSEKLMRMTRPVGFKQPELPKYDTIKWDHVSYVWVFENTSLLNQDGNLFCKLFPTTFTGETVTWFVN